MSNTTTTEFMLMVLPIPGEEIGPEWAEELIAALTENDAHDHSPDKGTYVTPAGLNINQDLDLADKDTADPNNVRNARAVTFASLDAALSAIDDYGSFFVVGVDVWFIDGNGNAIQITQDGAVLVAAGNISGMTGNASVVFSTDTYVFSSDTATPGNIDAGNVRFREPVANGKGVRLKAPAALAANYDLTFPAALPGATVMLTVTSAGVIAASAAPVIAARPTFIGVNPGDTSDTTAGNIRYHGADIQGYVGGVWRTLLGIVGYARTRSGALQASTVVIPFDNSIPQKTEGTQWLSKAYTATRVGNLLRVRVKANVSVNVTNAVMCGALFRDSAADAVAATAMTGPVTLDAPTQFVLEWEEVVADLSAHTFAFRAGPAVGSMTMNLNHITTGGVTAQFGGVADSYIEVEEIAQ